MKLNAVLEDVIRKYKVSPEYFILSGYSAGGIVALRYVELCNEFPDKYPIKPKGIFTVDSPPIFLQYGIISRKVIKINIL